MHLANLNRKWSQLIKSWNDWRRHWPECVGRVNRTFCFTDVSYRAQLLKGRLMLNPGFFFVLQKFLSDNFLCYF